MPLMQVNAAGPEPCLDAAALELCLGRLPRHAPVVALIHGFRYAPGVGRHCPHDHILSVTPRRDLPRAISWPRHLRLNGPDEGLALAFGWNARGTIWQAQARTDAAATALARLVAMIRRIDPDRPVDIMAHSLGARVALAALSRVEPQAVGRMLLLAPADFRTHAEAALRSPAGRTAEIVSVTCRANALFDFIVETVLAARLDACVAQGLSAPQANWLDLMIDDGDTEAALAALGFPLRPASARVCHWQPYLRPGLFGLYRALLARRIGLAQIRASLRHVEQASALQPAPVLSLPGNPA